MRTCARNKTGQTAIEFVVCLLLILLVLTGIIHVARLATLALPACRAAGRCRPTRNAQRNARPRTTHISD